MGKVQLLPDDLINKIAAGEVVERPASVIKELVENSLDAGAKRVEVDVERGGKRLMRVVDDGQGMSEEDALMALKRHATSKIREENDLFRILTMGFRGEAVPSIASVSRFTLETRTEEEEAGVRVVLEGGGEPQVSGAARSVGTTVDIRDLFFNLPARSKFLKADGTEFSHIAEAVTRLAMSHPDVRFRLTHNGRVQLQAQAAPNLQERVGALLGRQVGEAMYPFSFSSSWLQLKGLFSRPEMTTKGTKGVYLFVNGRFFRHRGFAHACQEAYRGTIEKGRYPYIVMFLEIDPERVDVNVHPQKIEVRFQRENEIYSRVLTTLRNAIARTPWVEHVKPATGELAASSPLNGTASQSASYPASSRASGLSFEERVSQAASASQGLGEGSRATSAASASASPSPGTGSASTQSASTSTSKPAPRNFQEFQQRFMQAAKAQNIAHVAEGRAEGEAPPAASAQSGLSFLPGWDPMPDGQQALGLVPASTQTSTPSGEQGPTTQAPGLATTKRETFFSSLQYIGQFSQMYLIFEWQDKLIMLDQHAAHERIAYQHLLQKFSAESIPLQRFLIPPRLELSLAEAQHAEQYQEELARLGIELEPFGGQSFALKALPDILKKGDHRALVSDLLEELADGKKTASLDQRRDEVLMRMACHSSVRGPHKLSEEEVRALMVQLDEIDFKANCPHGRPIYFEMPKGDIEKRFHRT